MIKLDLLWTQLGQNWAKTELDRVQALVELKPCKIRSMNEPPSEIKDIMKAVFVLLGEAPSKLETWTGIRALIGKTGPESLRRRICEFNPKSLINQEVTVKHAKSLCKNQSQGLENSLYRLWLRDPRTSRCELMLNVIFIGAPTRTERSVDPWFRDFEPGYLYRGSALDPERSLFRVRRLSVGTAVFYSWCQITIDALEHYSDSLVRTENDIFYFFYLQNTIKDF